MRIILAVLLVVSFSGVAMAEEPSECLVADAVEVEHPVEQSTIAPEELDGNAWCCYQQACESCGNQCSGACFEQVFNDCITEGLDHRCSP